MNEFVARHADGISFVLHCFDRMIFHGHLPINYPQALTNFLAADGVDLKRFAVFVQRQSEGLRQASEEMARVAGRPCVFIKRYIRKEEWAHRVARRDGVREGLVGILRTVEKCRSFTVRPGRYGPRLVSSTRRCLHLYFYFIDPQLGWIHIRLQTWFPFLIQVGVNGHDILERQLIRDGMRYERVDNAFHAVEDPRRAQRLADRIATWNWSLRLDRLANPLLGGLLRSLRYRWVIDQCEYATDVVFRDPDALAPLYRQLVRHANLCFAAEDILGFFGRPLHGLIRGEVVTETRPCHWGYRVKHRVGRNWIKMYDKAGTVLRVETVINRPQDFRVRRLKHRHDGTRVLGLFALPKAVVFLPRFAEIQQRANRHYLRALAAVENPARAYDQLEHLTLPAVHQGRRYRGINPLQGPARDIMRAVLRCEHHLQGFRNEQIRKHVHPDGPPDPKAVKRASARIRRRLLILRAHGYIRRMGGSRRYRVTERGLQIMSSALFYSQEQLPNLLMKSA